MDTPADLPPWFASFLSKTLQKLDRGLTAFHVDMINHLNPALISNARHSQSATSSTDTSIDSLLKERIEALKKSFTANGQAT
ncbi:Uu.00g130110.m01.CDS01 [Anthostomella pinea]|uniref:Uu.00g130110.m01.CDS01 n=1 Tax=Anthostomella pinea TaxID=933095 RepID=A0AAI8VDB3_9PEZI|nr:Uu.00g130110.m01.CDS01 [Anthostomella pinea]